MEYTETKTIERDTNLNDFANSDSDSTQKRLESLLAANAEYARQEEIFKNDFEKFEVEIMKNPYSTKKAFSIFGLMLGSIPPATIFGKMIAEGGLLRSDEIGWILLFFAVNLITAIVGYFSGKKVGKIVSKLEQQSWHTMLLAMPFIGLLWGIISGGAGGVLIFLIGAVVGAFFGGMVGAVALPAFAALHRVFKSGDQIESQQFYPIAFGITAVISAIIIGL